MTNPMDNFAFAQSHANNEQMNFNQLQQMFNMARQNPQAFEQQIKQNNPQAYAMACQLRNNMTPQNAIMQLARQRGINPNIFRMLGL